MNTIKIKAVLLVLIVGWSGSRAMAQKRDRVSVIRQDLVLHLEDGDKTYPIGGMSYVINYPRKSGVKGTQNRDRGLFSEDMPKSLNDNDMRMPLAPISNSMHGVKLYISMFLDNVDDDLYAIFSGNKQDLNGYVVYSDKGIDKHIRFEHACLLAIDEGATGEFPTRVINFCLVFHEGALNGHALQLAQWGPPMPPEAEKQ